MKYNSSKSGILVNDEPLYKSEHGMKKSYYMYEEFDKVAVPSGWNLSTSGTGGSSFNQVSETGTIGLYQITSGVGVTVPPNFNRSGLIYSNGAEFLREFQDSLYCRVTFHLRNNAPIPLNGMCFFGWSANHAVAPNAFGNTLGIMYDPTNISGFNPSLITNLFLVAYANYSGLPASTVVDLNTLPTSTWREFTVMYDATHAKVYAYLGDTEIGSMSNLDNVPCSLIRGTIPTGAGALKPMFYVANNFAGIPTASMGLRVDKCSMYKLFSF